MQASSTFTNLKQDNTNLFLLVFPGARVICLACSLNLISVAVYDKTYYCFVGVGPKNGELNNKKAHRKELQRIIACSIYNKI